MNLGNIMRRETGQTEKIKNHKISIHLWSKKLKTTNKEDKHKLIDTDNSMAVTKGKEGWRVVKGKGFQP